MSGNYIKPFYSIETNAFRTQIVGQKNSFELNDVHKEQNQKKKKWAHFQTNGEKQPRNREEKNPTT